MTQQGEQEAIQERPVAVHGRSRSASFLQAVFGRHLMDTAILLLLPLVLSGLSLRESVMADPDLWWHVANARILFESHHFIHVEPYSFTVAGQGWVDPEWLSEAPFWLGYKVSGLAGIYFVAWLGVSLNVLFLYWRGYWRSRNASVTLWVTVLGFVLMWVNAHARTILFGYLAMSAAMAILEAAERGHRRILWLLPPLFCVWINLHGIWIVGIGLLVLYIASGLFAVNAGIFRQDKFSVEQRNRLLLVLIASLAALFVNPYGWRLVWNPLDMMFGQSLNIANVIEWQPLNLSWNVGKAALVAIALTVLANAIHSRSWKVYEIAFVFFAWYAAFDHARFTFLASVVTIPMLTSDVARSFFPTPNTKTIPLMNGLVAACMAGVIIWYFPSQTRLQEGLVRQFPLQTIASVQPSWRMLNEEQIGGMMDFRSKPTFIDTRWDTFEHHGVMSDYIDAVRIQDPLKVLDKYRIDHALLLKNQALTYVLERTPGWTVIRKEGTGEFEFELLARTPATGGR